MLFSASGLHLDFGNGPVLNNESLDAREGEKIGLVGENGTGKSTLLRILAGEETCQGKIIRTGGMKVHLLTQTPSFSEKTIWQQMQAQNQALRNPREDYELKAVLTQLGLDSFDQEISTLSGGQQRRLSLALALADRADLLLLDEPTNHLDIEMIEWLEKWIRRSKQTIISVTHDRYFLDSACDRILELKQGNLYSYEGNFEQWVQQKQAREELEASRAQKLENLYRKELEWVRAGVQARSTKSKSRLDRFEELRSGRTKVQNQKMEMNFLSERLGRKTIEWKDLAFGYQPDQLLFSGFSYLCRRTDRIGLTGRNGSGKSTFLNLLAGDLIPCAGEIEQGSTVKIGYFRQNWKLEDPSVRVLDYIEEAAREVQTLNGTLSASAMLERFRFDKTRQYLPVERLSGGEQRRLYLVRTLMSAPNLLLLDEPGNDLDILTLEILEDYLDDFPGIVITVSHDRYFLDRICTEIFDLEADRKWHRFTGGYSDLLLEKEKREKAARENQIAAPKKTRTRRPSLSSKEKQLLETIPLTLEQIVGQIDDLDRRMGETQDYEAVMELSRQREELETQTEKLETLWMELEEKREQLAL